MDTDLICIHPRLSVVTYLYRIRPFPYRVSFKSEPLEFSCEFLANPDFSGM